MSKYFVFACAFVLVFSVLVQAQNHTGFISIDCGLSSETLSYIDESSGITYVSDGNYTTSGVNFDISEDYKQNVSSKQFETVRSFPEGKRNCYTLKPSHGKNTRYLIRARFLYGNYDQRGVFPLFALYLGVDLWDTVSVYSEDTILTKEIVYSPLSGSVDVCLVKTGVTVPFISVLELRPLNNETYVSEPGSGLHLFERINFNANGSDYMRYNDDIYDRLWSPLKTNVWTPIEASSKDKRNMTENLYAVPPSVMGTAYTRNATNRFMSITWSELNIGSRYFLYFHFAELAKLGKNQLREFDISLNGKFWYGPLSPAFLGGNTIYSTLGRATTDDGKLEFSLNVTKNSTLPPILNAMEVYELRNLPQVQTDKSDVEAISNIKSTYDVKRNSWQGDPCAPEEYVWDGLNCSYNGNDSHRITSLDLSSSGLEGEISSYISDLTMLEYLDLSNNSLEGTVPESLAGLSFLRVLNLKGNSLNGPVPALLLERSKNGSLAISADASLVGVNSTSPTTSPSKSTPSTANSLQKKELFSIFLFIAGYLILYFV